MCGPTSHQAPYPLLAEQATRPVRPLPIRSIQEKRIHEFIGGQFASDNVSSLLYAGRTNAAAHVQIQSWSPSNGTRPNFAEASAQTFQPCRIGDKFGPSWSNHWLKLTLTVPVEWADLDGVELEFDASCEALIFDQHGSPLQGFTGGQEFDRRHDFPLPKGDRTRMGAVYYVEISHHWYQHGLSVAFFPLFPMLIWAWRELFQTEYGGDGKKAATGNYLQPAAAYPAHTAPNGLLFYTGQMFPEKYRNGAFIAFHGSWNRAPEPQKGYYVVFQPFVNGKPSGQWEVFADNFSGSAANTASGRAAHRPCGLAQGPDGSLYVSDDSKGTIYRIVYNAKK